MGLLGLYQRCQRPPKRCRREQKASFCNVLSGASVIWKETAVILAFPSTQNSIQTLNVLVPDAELARKAKERAVSPYLSIK